MLYQTKIAGYNDMLDSVKNYASQITPEQVGYGLGGAAGGAALGYLASHLLDRKASTKRRLLYALLGAASGAGISEYALSRMRRAPAVVPEEIEEAPVASVASVPVKRKKPVNPWISPLAISGALVGTPLYPALKGTGIVGEDMIKGALIGYGAGVGASYLGRKYGTPR